MHPELIDQRTGQSRPLCIDCGEPFDRELDEIAARRGAGMPVSPRCPACRIARRVEHNTRIMDTLRAGDLRGISPVSAGPPDAADRLYLATCAECRRPIRLPFKPRLDRPVYCRFCRDARSGR